MIEVVSHIHCTTGGHYKNESDTVIKLTAVNEWAEDEEGAESQLGADCAEARR